MFFLLILAYHNLLTSILVPLPISSLLCHEWTLLDFKYCNKWTEKGLQSAGKEIEPTLKLTVGSVMNVVR